MNYNINIDGHIGPWGYSQGFVRQQLAAMANKPVAVRLNSPGGYVSHALDIRQQFLDHGDVTCYLFGYVASAATILATGAKKTCMSKYAFYMVHKVSNWVDAWGQYNADQIQQIINDLMKNKAENDKMDLVMAALYSKKCGKPVKDILELLKEGRWMTAQEAKDFGFVDEIIEDGEKINFDDSLKMKFNMYGLPALPQTEQSDFRQAFARELAAEPQEHVSWFQSFMNRLRTKKNEITTMKTELNFINEALGNDVIEADNDGKVTLTAEQLTKLNSHIGNLNTKVSEKENKITELQQQVDNLNKADGDETTKFADGGSSKAKTVDDMYNMIKDLV